MPFTGWDRPKASSRLRRPWCIWRASRRATPYLLAFGAAKRYVEEHPSFEVPLRLRNAPTQLSEELGHGEGYRYDHDEDGGYAAGERYFPDEMDDEQFYFPTDRGLERNIARRLATLRARDALHAGHHAKDGPDEDDTSGHDEGWSPNADDTRDELK